MSAQELAGQEAAESSTARSDEAHTTPWSKKYILTLDGGGVRGYSTLLIIQELMRICDYIEAEATSSSDPLPFQLSQGSAHSRSTSSRYLPVHYFDYVAGTSTGGLIAIMLSRLRMTIDDCITEYATMGQRIFGSPRRFSMRGPFPWNREKYDHRKLEAAVKDVIRRHDCKSDQVGGSAYRSDEDQCRTIVLAIRENNAAFANYLFRTYEHLKSPIDNALQLNPGPPSPLPIYKVALATIAAPTYFKPIVINNEKFLDGSYGAANNPAWQAFFEVKQMNQGNNDLIGLLLSIGTGKADRVHPVARRDTGLWNHGTAMLNYATVATSDSEDTHLRMLALTEETRVPYERFNVEDGLGDGDWGEWRVYRRENLTLERIRERTAAYLAQIAVRERLFHVARVLVKNRQERSKDKTRWNKVATDYRYRCTIMNCSQSTMFASEEDLRSHLLERHHDLGLQSLGTPRDKELRRESLIQPNTISSSEEGLKLPLQEQHHDLSVQSLGTPGDNELTREKLIQQASGSPVALRIAACVECFADLILIPPDRQRESKLQITFSVFDEAFGRFKMWAGSIGAFQHNDRLGSLDNRLRNAQPIRDEIIELLEDLEEALQDINSIARGGRDNLVVSLSGQLENPVQLRDLDGRPSARAPQVSEIEEILMFVSSTITGLFRVSTLISNATPRDMYARALAAVAPERRFDEHHDIAHVRDSFRNLEDWFIERLGKAITQRRECLRYTKEHREKQESTYKSKAEEYSTSRNSHTPGESSTLASTQARNYSLDSGASTLDTSRIAFNTGILVETQSADTRSLASDLSEETLDYDHPILYIKKVNRQGRVPFECPLCWQSQDEQSESQWRHHIFYDLRAYVCTSKECDPRLFSSRLSWSEHENQNHYVQWRCPYCFNSLFKSKVEFERHLHSRHGNSFTDPTQLSAMLADCQQPWDLFAVSKCPFCDWEKVKTLRKDNLGLPEDEEIYVLPHEFYRHVGHHMEDLALSAVRPSDYQLESLIEDLEPKNTNGDDLLAR